MDAINGGSARVLLECDDLVEHPLPEGWRERGNVLLGPPDLAIPWIEGHEGVDPPTNARLVLHEPKTDIGYIAVWGDGCRVVVGRGAHMPKAGLSVGVGGSILIDGSLSCSQGVWLDARNGGCISVGEEGLWSTGVRITTDDMHAIRDRQGVRVNRRGSSVTVGRHVWLGMDVVVQPGAVIGDDVVIGVRSVVSGAIPSGVVAAGVPARVVREGVTWTYEDLD